MEGKRCLVTGAAGFIGSHLCRRLASQGAEVHALVRPGSGPERIVGIADRITIHRVDMVDRDTMEACLKSVEPDLVFHLATPTRGLGEPTAEASRSSVDTILLPLIDLVDILAALPRPPINVVRAGTIAEYGHIAVPYREHQHEEPVTPYGAAMLAGTKYLGMLASRLPFPIVSARLALTYGPDQSRDFLLPSLFEACSRGDAIEIRRPEDRRDLIHVEDVVDALICLAGDPRPGASHVNICTGIAPTMREVALMVAEAMNADPGLLKLGKTRAGEQVSHLLSDPGMAAQVYGWRPKIGIREGIGMLADHFSGSLKTEVRSRG